MENDFLNNNNMKKMFILKLFTLYFTVVVVFVFSVCALLIIFIV